jgi:HPt (histidine-containing phosphotransfer) domain-containing protein
VGDAGETGNTVKKMAENVGLEENEYLPLLELFIETGAAYLDELRVAIESGDSKSVYETTHTIRGAAENLGIPEMSELARVVEIRARQNILEGAEEAVRSLLRELSDLRKIVH